MSARIEVKTVHCGGDPGKPSLIDGGLVMWWGWKDTAREGALAIGWPVNSVWPVMTRFQYGYALKQEHGGFLVRESYEALLADRQAPTPGAADDPAGGA